MRDERGNFKLIISVKMVDLDLEKWFGISEI